MAKNKAKQRIYLSEEEKKVLASLLNEWNSQLDKKSRDSFITSEALPKIQAMNMSKYGPEVISRDKEAKKVWEERVQAVHTWFKNNKPYKDRAVFKLERKIPLRHVIGKLKADEIHEKVVAADPDVEKGDKTYPGHFQKGLTSVMNALTKEEMEEMERIREEWQNVGPPIDVRLNAAKKYSRKGIINAHQLLQKEMYVSCITFSFNPEADTGVMAVVCHDYIADLHAKTHGKRFKTFKEWNVEGYARIVQDMIGYANYVDQQRRDEADVKPEPVPINFESGPGNLPLLPPEVKGVKGMEIAKNAREIIRAYFLRHYQLATGCDNARTPWAVIGDNPSNFFDISSIPSDFKFQDPSRMGINVKSLLSHLRARQEELGVNAFKFHHVLRNNKLESAEYPEDARVAMEGTVLPDGTGGQIGAELVSEAKTSKTVKSGSRSPVKTPRGKKVKKGKDQLHTIPPTPKCESISAIPLEEDKPATLDGIANQLPSPCRTTSHTVATPSFPLNTGPVTSPVLPLRDPTAFLPAIDFSGFPKIESNPMPPVILQNDSFVAHPPAIPVQQLMAYMLQHMRDTQTPPNGIGYHLETGAPAVPKSVIDPQLLPKGPPPFSNVFPRHQSAKETENGIDKTGFPFVPPTDGANSESYRRTPKRKLSQGQQDADLTPSRSHRKRRPTQKLKDSMEMANI